MTFRSSSDANGGNCALRYAAPMRYRDRAQSCRCHGYCPCCCCCYRRRSTLPLENEDKDGLATMRSFDAAGYKVILHSPGWTDIRLGGRAMQLGRILEARSVLASSAADTVGARLPPDAGSVVLLQRLTACSAGRQARAATRHPRGTEPHLSRETAADAVCGKTPRKVLSSCYIYENPLTCWKNLMLAKRFDPRSLRVIGVSLYYSFFFLYRWL